MDAQCRPLTVQAAGIAPVNYGYDNRGRLTAISQGSGAGAHTVRYAYNADGYVESVTDALNRTTRYAFDAAGRVKTTTLPDTRVIAFSYDPNGNVTSVTPPSRPAHGFGYNAIDQATDYTPPALGSQQVATQYAYNLDKQPVKAIRPDGQTVDFSYDMTSGRLTSLTAPTGVIGYSYQPNTGQLAGIAAPSGIGLAYSYDGALLTGASFTGPIAGSTSTTYDTFFRVKQTGVNGSNISFSYDDDGLLTSAGSLSLARDPANGFLTGSTLDQIVTSQTYDGFGQLASFTAKQGATVLYGEQYLRDILGRISQKTVTIGGQNNAYIYTYDNADRLTGVTKDGAAIGYFEYDANGNRTLANGVSASYDAQDRLTTFGTAQYSYTGNGELQQIVTGTAATATVYDVFGNLTHVDLPDGGKLDYLVDGRNRRIGKKVNGVLVQGFLYQDQLKPAAELDGQGNVAARFVYAGKANVPEYMVKGGSTYRIITDQLGSVRLVVNSGTGQVVQQLDYDAWGTIIQDTNPGFQPFGFAGGLYDRHTGLVRFGARDYSAQIGRWVTKDPIGFNGGDTSLYNYAAGDPINRIDPDGLWAWGDPLPQGMVDFSAGFGDTLSFGGTNWIRNQMGTNGAVNKCSGAYGAGELTGVAFDIALGGAAGWEAAGAKGAGKEFSHWIPNRMGGPRSKWNGNYVSTAEHALSDPYRYQFMPRAWKEANPMPNQLVQQWNRIPNVYKGGAAGAAAGGAGAANSGCECQ